MTMREYVEQQAKRFGMIPCQGLNNHMVLRTWGDKTSGADLLQLLAVLEESRFMLRFDKSNAVIVTAPHSHEWDANGWGCTWGLTEMGCHTFHKAGTTPG